MYSPLTKLLCLFLLLTVLIGVVAATGGFIRKPMPGRYSGGMTN